MLDPGCCVDFSLVEARGGCSPEVAHGLLIAVVSPVAEHKLYRAPASVAVVPEL